MLCQEYDEQTTEQDPDISFSAKDHRGLIPHDDDPMVITLQIFKWDIKRVLINPGSSADIIYYDTFDRMGLDPEQLQPFNELWRDSPANRFTYVDTSLSKQPLGKDLMPRPSA